MNYTESKIAQARIEGREEGVQLGIVQSAIAMVKNGFPLDKVASALSLSEEALADVKKRLAEAQ